VDVPESDCFFCSVERSIKKHGDAFENIAFVTTFVMGMDLGSQYKHFASAVNVALNMACAKHAANILDDVRARGKSAVS
jgi:hypothetical protein